MTIGSSPFLDRAALRAFTCLGAVAALYAAALAVLAAAATPLQAQEARRCRVPDFPAPELCARAGLDTLRATYVVMVDESGSMRPLWGAVQRALAEFAQAVPDGDELDVRLFSGTVHNLIAPVPATPQARADWARRFAALPQPTGAHTDLGVAAQSALQEIGSAPASRQQFVFFLTDGQQDPEVGSPFPTEWAGNWPALQQQARTLAGSRPVSFAVVRLTDAADRSLLSRALPDAVVSDAIGPEALRAWFARAARDVAAAKLRLRITEELRRPAFEVTAAEPLRVGGSADGSAHALRTTIGAVILDTATAQLRGGVRLAARPRAGGTPPADDSHTLPMSLAAVGSAGPWYLPPARWRDSIVATAPARVRLEPAAELARLGVEPGPRADSLRVRVLLQGASPLRVALYWLAVVALVVGVVYLVRRMVWASHRPRLAGQLRLERSGGADESVVDLTPLNLPAYRITTPSGRTVATLEARNERGRTAVWAVPDGEPVSLNGRPLRTPERVSGAGRLEHRDLVAHVFLR